MDFFYFLIALSTQKFLSYHREFKLSILTIFSTTESVSTSFKKFLYSPFSQSLTSKKKLFHETQTQKNVIIYIYATTNQFLIRADLQPISITRDVLFATEWILTTQFFLTFISLRWVRKIRREHGWWFSSTSLVLLCIFYACYQGVYMKITWCFPLN